MRHGLFIQSDRAIVVRWDEGFEAAVARHPEVFRAGGG